MRLILAGQDLPHCAIMNLKQTVKNKDEEYRFPNGIGE